MFHYLVTFKTSIQAYNSAPFLGQRRCDSRVQGMGALKLLKSMAHVIRFQSLYILSLTLRTLLLSSKLILAASIILFSRIFRTYHNESTNIGAWQATAGSKSMASVVSHKVCEVDNRASEHV